MREYMERRVTQPQRVTSPTRGPPPQRKQALAYPLKRSVDGERGVSEWTVDIKFMS